MANIKVKIGYPIKDGTGFTFHTPCDCSKVEGVAVEHPGGTQNFIFKDAHGNDLGDNNNLFAAGSLVKVILDVTNSAALIQNADTNGYLEQNMRSVRQEIAAERARIDQFTALEEGSTTGDAELMDLRVDCTGKQWENAGAAVRGVTGELRSAFDINYCVNLLNPNALEYDVAAGGGGELDWGEGTSGNFAVTDYIAVTPGEELTYQRKNPTTGTREIATARWENFDGEHDATGDFPQHTVHMIPSGCSYVRVWLPENGQSEEMAIVKTTEVIPYEPYTDVSYTIKVKPECLPDVVNGELEAQVASLEERVDALEENEVEGAVLYTEQELTPEQQAQARENIGAVAEDETFERAVVETIVGKNLLNVNAVAPDPADPYSGGFWRKQRFYDDGTISGNADSCITDFILVKQGMPLVFSSNYTGAWAGMMGRRVIGYDENKNFVKLVTSSTNYASAGSLTGVAFVRIQLSTTYVDANGQVEYSTSTSVRTEYEPYTETVVYAYGLKPSCLPNGFADLPDRVTALEQKSGAADTLAIDKARFDGRFNYVAYSAINGIGKDQNSREFFAWAAKKEFTALKGDIEITADGKLIMCHDAGFTLDGDGKITTYNSATATPIHDMTEADCLALQHARYGGTVCSFEEYVRICKKYGKIAWITVRNHYVDEYVPELMRVLRKYGMVKQCIISGYPSNAPLQAVREADQTIMLAWVLGKNANITTDHIDYALSMGNCLICGFHFSSASDDVATKLAGSLAAIEYAHNNDIRVYDGQVHTMEIADKCMEYGITGAQIMFNPSFE